MTPWIVVQLTVEDLVAFNLHMFATSPRMKKQVRRLQALLVPVLVLGTVWMWATDYRRGSVAPLAWLLWGAFGLMTVFLGTITRWRIPARVRRSAARGPHPGLAPMRLWVDERGGLVVEAPDRTTWYKPEAVTRVEETPDHVFIHLGELQGVIIPRRLGEPVVQTFLTALRRHRPPEGVGAHGTGVPAPWRA